MKTPLSRIVPALVALALVHSTTAGAHAERVSFYPQNRHGVPAYRPMLPVPQSPRLVVCKKPGDEGVAVGDDSASRIARFNDDALRQVNLGLLAECQFEHIQAAVDAVKHRGTTIYILPGLYLEQPSIRSLETMAGAATPADKAFCQAFLASGRGTLSYEEQFRCPHLIQLVGIFGDRNPADDDCGTDPEGACTHPATQACDTAVNECEYYDLQIEGTGERNSDVVLRGGFYDRPGDPVDGEHVIEVGLRGDRTDGLYLRNFTSEVFREFGPYVMEADGYVFDRLNARFVDEYSYLTFATDHGRFVDTEGCCAGDSALYPGGQSNLYGAVGHAGVNQQQRFSTEIVNSSGHHSSGGYSGTGGDAVWVHHTKFYKNIIGLVTDSLYPNHPGMPQNHGLYEENWIYGNNKQYVDFWWDGGPCGTQNNPVKPRDSKRVPPEILDNTFNDLPPEAQEAILDRTVVCPTIPGFKGTGFMIAGGNYDVIRNNKVFDQWKRGLMLFHVPEAFRHDDPSTSDPNKEFDTSHWNQYIGNHFAENTLLTPSRVEPNGPADLWFDDSGTGNCWSGNTSVLPGGVTEDTQAYAGTGLPSDCTADGGGPPSVAIQQASHNEGRIGFLAPCALWVPDDPSTKAGCTEFDPLTAPAGRPNAPVALASRPIKAQSRLGQVTRAGYVVLNNDSGSDHEVASVTIDVGGAFQFIKGMTVTVMATTPAPAPASTSTGSDIGTFTATVTSVGASNVLTFNNPVPVLAEHYVLFNLDVDSGTTVAMKSGGAVLASGGGALAVLAGLLVAVPGRRRPILSAAMALAAALFLSSCGSSESIGNGPISFTLTAMDVSDGTNPVTYAGLPVKMGSVSLH